MKELLELYQAFFRIGCVNFGGGYAMLPLLEKDLVDKRGWTTMDDLMSIADAGKTMPPKSTWFEPKLLSGLFIHELS